jgi:hypothetical protein
MPIQTSLDYTSKDFDALRDRLFNVIPSAFPDWTDRQVADFGNILVELFAFCGDVLGFYQDNQAQESRWTSARLRRSLFAMTKLIGYVPPGASAATTDLTIQLSEPPTGSVSIDVGDVFRTRDATSPVVFQAITAATIAAGEDPPIATITVENSSAAQDIVQSTNLPNQEYQLGEAPFLDSSLTIAAADGAYTIVDDFLSSTGTDHHATVTVDENNKARVRFGDGISGSVPSGAITFTYKTGGGFAGNVSSNTIQKADRAYVDNFGTPVTISVTNLQKAGGGFERQTVEGIRSGAPRSLRTLTRTVSREDYETNALRVPGVARALMLSVDESPSILENNGALYIVPAGGGAASSALIDAVRTNITITYPKTITFKASIFSALYLPVNITTRVHLSKGAVPGVVGPAIRKSLIGLFAITNLDGSENDAIDFGYYMEGALAWSDVFNAIRDTAGVRKIDDGLGNLTLNLASEDVEVPLAQFPILGTVTIVDAITGLALP